MDGKMEQNMENCGLTLVDIHFQAQQEAVATQGDTLAN